MSKIPVNDAALISAYIQGDSKAFETLLNRSKSKVYTTIYLIVKDRYIAEDLLQETYIKALDVINQGKYNEEGKFLPWVMRIAHNLIVDHYRSNKKMPLYRETEDFSIFSIMTDDALTIENKLISDQVSNDLRQLVEELPVDQKEVLMMRLYQDMSFKEISEATGVSINTALGRMRYALLNLRKVIDKHQITLTN